MIAGAGIAGIATAHQLACVHGITDVVLVDPRPPLSLTSNKTGANYRDWWPRRPMAELARRSIDIMRCLLAEGGGFTMNRRGYLYVTTDQERARGLPGLVSSYPAEADVLEPDTIRAAFPHLAPGVCGAIHARNAGSFDTVALGTHLLALAQGRGMRLMRGEVTCVECSGDGVRAVTVGGTEGPQQITTRRFVNAAGPFVGRVAGLLGVSLPVSTVLQQKVAFADSRRVVPGDAPFTISLDPQAPLPAGLHIKADEQDDAPLVKIGWAYNQSPEPPVWEPQGSPAFARRVLDGAARVIPGLQAYVLAGATPVAHDAGYYVQAPDELPIIGRLGVEGAYVVGALAGFGGMVACAAGEIAAGWITGREQPGWALDFVPDRFTDSAARPVTAGTPSGAL